MPEDENTTATNVDEQFFIVNKEKLKEVLGISELKDDLGEFKQNCYEDFSIKFVQLKEILRELFQRMGDYEDLTVLGYTLLEKLDSKDGEKECPHGTLGGKEHCMKCRPELMKDSKPSEPIAGSARQTEDIRWLWRHAGHDDDIETLEEYHKKMIELEEKYLTEGEDADE